MKLFILSIVLATIVTKTSSSQDFVELPDIPQDVTEVKVPESQCPRTMFTIETGDAVQVFCDPANLVTVTKSGSKLVLSFNENVDTTDAGVRIVFPAEDFTKLNGVGWGQNVQISDGFTNVTALGDVDGGAKLYATFTNLASSGLTVSASGGAVGTITSNMPFGAVSASGGGRLSLNNDVASVKSSGGATVEIHGSITDGPTDVSGGAGLIADGSISGSASVTGGARLTVATVNEAATITASGGGSVKVDDCSTVSTSSGAQCQVRNVDTVSVVVKEQSLIRSENCRDSTSWFSGSTSWRQTWKVSGTIAAGTILCLVGVTY